MILTTEYSKELFSALAQAGYKNSWETDHSDPYITFGSNAFSYGTSPNKRWSYIKPDDAFGFLLLQSRESKVEYLTYIGIELTEGERNMI